MTGTGALRTLQRVTAILAVACGTIGGGVARSASPDPIPPEWLQQQHDTCVESCASADAQLSSCEQNCACIVTEESATMSRDEYAILSNAAAAGQDIPPDLKEKLLTISDRCKED
jgi:hypothetical protein